MELRNHFIYLCAAQISGILLASQVQSYDLTALVLNLILIATLVMVMRNYGSSQGFKSLIFFGLYLCCISITFYTLVRYFPPHLHEKHLMNVKLSNGPHLYFGEITDVAHSPKFCLDIKLKGVKREDSMMAIIGKCKLIIVEDDFPTLLNRGDWILFKTSLREIDANAIPGFVDWKAHYLKKGISHRGWISNQKDLKIIRKNRSFWLQKLKGFKGYVQRVWVQNIPDEEQRALLNAMFLGDKSGLSKQMKTLFSNAGVMHILAVSGLHVGLIYLFLDGLLWIFNFWFQKRFFRFVVILSCIWFYAMATGMSPSVIRAATMFTLMLLGKTFQSKTNTLNILAFSAFVNLGIDPMLLYNVGFQLSHLAVFGISFLYPIVYQLIPVKRVMLEKIWALMCVSLSAQLITAPLTILYFGLFPNYFLLANLLLIPIVTILVFLGISLLIFSFISWVSTILGFVLNALLDLLIFLLIGLNQLPWTTIQLDITPTVSILVYAAILGLFAAVSWHKKWPIKVALLVLMFGVGKFSLSRMRIQQKEHIYIMNYRNSLLLGVEDVRGHRIYSIQANPLEASREFTKFLTHQQAARPQYIQLKPPAASGHEGLMIKLYLSGQSVLFIKDFDQAFVNNCEKDLMDVATILVDGHFNAKLFDWTKFPHLKKIFIQKASNQYQAFFINYNEKKLRLLEYNDYVPLNSIHF